MFGLKFWMLFAALAVLDVIVAIGYLMAGNYGSVAIMTLGALGVLWLARGYYRDDR